MADFTQDEIKALKRQAKLADLFEAKNNLQESKSREISDIKNQASIEIDEVNADYNPQIDAIQIQIENA